MTSTTVDGAADVIGATVVLRGTNNGSFGTSATSPLEINATTLNADVTGTGTLHVRDTAGGVTVALAQTANADLSLEAAGAAATLTLAQVVAGSAHNVTLSSTGAINGTPGGATDVTASSLAVTTATGIAAAATPLETAVSTLAVNVGSGGAFVTNTSALAIGTVGSVVGVTAAGAVVLTAADTAAADNLTVNAAIHTTVGDITLQSGDVVTVPVGATVQADAGAVTLSGGFTDSDGDGGGVTLLGNAGGTLVTVQGSAATDTFNVQPTGTSPLTVIADSADIANAAFRLLGAGTNNTLQLTGAAFTLNLLDPATLAKIDNLQTLDLRTGAANYTVPLSKAVVRAISGANHTLVVPGSAGDVVQIGNRWKLGTNETIGGVTFKVYTQEDVTLKVQQGVTGAFAAQTLTLPVFAISASDRQVYRQFEDVHGAFGSGVTLTAPGQFLNIVVSTYGAFDAPLLFGLGLDHRVYVARFDNQGTLLSGWVQFAPGFFDSLATAYYGDNQATILFGLGTATAGSRQVFAARFDVTGAFVDGWVRVAPGHFQSLAAGSYGTSRDRAEVLGVGLDNNVYFARYSNTGVFIDGWIPGPAGPVSALAVGNLAGGGLEVFGLGTDQQTRLAQTDVNGLFVGGFTLGPTGASTSLVAAGVASHEIVLFGLGTDQQVRRATFNSTTGAFISGFTATAPGSMSSIAATAAFDFIELYGIGTSDRLFGALFNPNGTLNSGFYAMTGTFTKVAVK
jgi:hypothetical protein